MSRLGSSAQRTVVHVSCTFLSCAVHNRYSCPPRPCLPPLACLQPGWSPCCSSDTPNVLPVQALASERPCAPNALPPIPLWLFIQLLQVFSLMSPCVKLYHPAHCPTPMFPFSLFCFIFPLSSYHHLTYNTFYLSGLLSVFFQQDLGSEGRNLCLFCIYLVCLN